jgi:hypothetical protein
MKRVVMREQKWDARLRDLVAYHNTFGTWSVKRSHDEKLQAWVRFSLTGTKRHDVPRTPAQLAKLRAVGFPLNVVVLHTTNNGKNDADADADENIIWSGILIRDQKWDARLQDLVHHHNLFGTWTVKKHDNRTLNAWVQFSLTGKTRPDVRRTPAQLAKLRAVGFPLNVLHEEWHGMLVDVDSSSTSTSTSSGVTVTSTKHSSSLPSAAAATTTETAAP